MKIKLKPKQVRVHEVASCFQLDVILFPDYHGICVSAPLADFLLHCEILGLKIGNEFTIDDGCGNDE